MKTYAIKGDDNRMFAFEISNAYIGASTIASLLLETSNVTNLTRRKPLRGSADIHIEFQYAGVDFVVWEAYGDNSRYWIGPKNDSDRSVDIRDLEARFVRYQPPLWRRIVGDLLTLNLRSLLGRG